MARPSRRTRRSAPAELDPVLAASYRRQESLCCICLALCVLVGFGPWVVHRLDRHSFLEVAHEAGRGAGGSPAPVVRRKTKTKAKKPCVPLAGECLNRCAARNEGTCLPKFLIIGARKAGTTSLYQYLSQHPSAVGFGLDRGATAGELQFFNSDTLFTGAGAYGGRRRLAAVEPDRRRLAKGADATKETKKNATAIAPWPRARLLGPARKCQPHCKAGSDCYDGKCYGARAWYAAMYPCVTAGRVAGDASVAYLVHGRAPQRAAKFCGASNLKIVAVLREPIARFQSQFEMRVRLMPHYANKSADDEANMDLASFARVVRSDKHWWRSDRPPDLFRPARNGIYEGIYVAHLKRWLALFPAPDRLRVYFYETFYLSGETRRNVEDVMAFVGLDPKSVDVGAIVNTSFNTHDGVAYKPRHFLSRNATDRLHNCFAPYNQRLSELLGVDQRWNQSLV